MPILLLYIFLNRTEFLKILLNQHFVIMVLSFQIILPRQFQTFHRKVMALFISALLITAFYKK